MHNCFLSCAQISLLEILYAEKPRRDHFHASFSAPRAQQPSSNAEQQFAYSGSRYIRYIKSFTEPVLSDFQVKQAVSQIDSGRLEPSWKTHRQHVKQLKARADSSADRKCPRCGSGMVLRKASRGANAGKKFWGCSGYPKCRMVQNVI
ncbi:MAG: topoisomerase DNA-binding C4 zinc finger domain-containing protein [Natronospirillum sp.]